MGNILHLVLILPSALAPIVTAIAFQGPRPTSTLEVLNDAAQGWSPNPTKAPSHNDLVRRADSRYQTCGWNGEDVAITCNAQSTCLIYNQRTSQRRLPGCCGSGNCEFKTTCFDYAAIQSSSCDQDCFRNPFVRLCTASDSPYCQTWTYQGQRVTDYGCANNGASTATLLKSAGPDENGTVFTLKLPVLSGSQVTLPTVASAASATSSDSSSSIPPIPTPTPTSSKSKTNVGAIAGGTVGGVVALAAIAGIIFFLLRKRRKNRTAAGGQAEYSHVHGGGAAGTHARYDEKRVPHGNRTQEAGPGEIHELPTTPVQEAEADHRFPVPEIDSFIPISEADSQPNHAGQSSMRQRPNQ